jgi:hypothetical protein
MDALAVRARWAPPGTRPLSMLPRSPCVHGRSRMHGSCLQPGCCGGRLRPLPPFVKGQWSAAVNGHSSGPVPARICPDLAHISIRTPPLTAFRTALGASRAHRQQIPSRRTGSRHGRKARSSASPAPAGILGGHVPAVPAASARKPQAPAIRSLAVGLHIPEWVSRRCARGTVSGRPWARAANRRHTQDNHRKQIILRDRAGDLRRAGSLSMTDIGRPTGPR